MANQSPKSSPPDQESGQKASENQPRSPQTQNRSRRLFWLGLGISVTGGAIALGWGAYKLESSLPESVNPVLTYAREGTVTIESADGAILQEIGPVTHEKLKIWEVPELVTQAFIASEDRRFYKHNGVDYQGVFRATLANLQARDVVEGGSSITQQLARITFLNQEVSLWRKLREIRLAQKIENQFDKEVILERYLNLVYLGSGAYGVGDAAWLYFGKTVDELTLPEAAMIAGLAPAPSLYSPFQNEEAAKQRRNLVLQRM
ncbi:MAG: transglycosylase domain-containing protein, partial [Chroococcales cyanobacterium]